MIWLKWSEPDTPRPFVVPGTLPGILGSANLNASYRWKDWSYSYHYSDGSALRNPSRGSRLAAVGIAGWTERGCGSAVRFPHYRAVYLLSAYGKEEQATIFRGESTQCEYLNRVRVVRVGFVFRCLALIYLFFLYVKGTNSQFSSLCVFYFVATLYLYQLDAAETTALLTSSRERPFSFMCSFILLCCLTSASMATTSRAKLAMPYLPPQA